MLPESDLRFLVAGTFQWEMSDGAPIWQAWHWILTAKGTDKLSCTHSLSESLLPQFTWHNKSIKENKLWQWHLIRWQDKRVPKTKIDMMKSLNDILPEKWHYYWRCAVATNDVVSTATIDWLQYWCPPPLASHWPHTTACSPVTTTFSMSGLTATNQTSSCIARQCLH